MLERDPKVALTAQGAKNNIRLMKLVVNAFLGQ
jgi:hypothetical protein